MKAIRIHQFGGPDVLQYEDVPDPSPKPGEALIRTEAAGVNFIDTYQRSGAYKIPLPCGPRPGRRGDGVGGGCWRHDRESRRQGGLDRHPRQLRRAACGRGRSAGRVAGRRHDETRRGDHAPGDDRPLSRDLHLSVEVRGYLPDSRRRGRRGAAPDADRKACAAHASSRRCRRTKRHSYPAMQAPTR